MHTIITTPKGERLVMVPEQEYLEMVETLEDTIDAAEAARIIEQIEQGEIELIPSQVVDRIIDGDNPIKVYREYRGLTTQKLAEAVGVSQGYISQIENSDDKSGNIPVKTLQKIAKVLKVDLDDIAPIERDAE